MLEEQHGVIAMKVAQQPDRVLGVRRHRDLPAGIVHELDLVGHRMPRVAALEETPGRAAPSARRSGCWSASAWSRIVDLLGRRLGIFAELDFGHGHQPGERHPTARPTIPSSLSEVSNTRSRPNFSCSPRVTAWTPPLGRRPRRTRARADWSRLLIEHAADRGDHVDPLASARLVGRRRRLIAAVPQAADLLQLAFVEDVARHLLGRGDAARLRLGERACTCQAVSRSRSAHCSAPT